MKAQNVDDFIKSIVCPKLNPTIYPVAEFIIKHKGKHIDEVSQCLVESGISKSSQSIFLYRLSHKIGRSIGTETQGLLAKSRDELIKRAEERRIYLEEHAKSLLGSAEDKWFNKELKITGISELSRAKRILQWINCLVEFSHEESLFIIPHPKHSTSCREPGENETSFQEIKERLQREQNPQEIDTQLSLHAAYCERKKTQIPPEESEEEKILKELWKHGYLKCDLFR